MSKELEELVGFLHSDQPQIRQFALEHAVSYTQGNTTFAFKNNDMQGVKDLKLLTRARQPRTVQLALTSLINLCDDKAVIDLLVSDEVFLIYVVNSLIEPTEANADLYCMLLANLAKNDGIHIVADMKRKSTSDDFKSNMLLDCLMDCFVKGSERKLNKYATFDYLAFFFADISRFELGRKYFVTKQKYDQVVPITKLLVFSESSSRVRREGVASTIKNVLFDVDYHEFLVHDDDINLLPYLLLPIAGPEELPEDEMFELPDELQLLPPDKKREPESLILALHVESILLLCATKKMREYLRAKSVYPLIRELHKAVEDPDVLERCDRVVQMLMRDEDPNYKEEEEAQVVSLLKEQPVEGDEEDEQQQEQDEDEDEDKIIEVL